MKNEKIITSVQDVKLPLTVKIGYTVGNFAKALLAVSTAAFLLYFYVDVCGINSKIASTIILLAKIWDIINDPMMGAIVDRTVSKEGRCRFYLKYFSVPAGIIFALSFFMPNFAMPGKIVWAAVTYVLQGMFSTVLLIPMNTLMGRITKNEAQQVQMSQFANIFSMAGTMIVTGLTMRMVSTAGGGDMVKGFAFVGIIYAIAYIACHLIVFFSTRGYEPLEHLAQQKSMDMNIVQEPLDKRLKALLQNTMWITIIAMFLVNNLAMALENAALPFYIQYNHGNDQNLYSIFSLIGTITVFANIAVLNILTDRIGVSGTAILGAGIAAVGYFYRVVAADASTTVIAVGWTLSQFGMGLISCVIFLLIFQSRDYGMRKTGIDNEAILMSGFSVSYKTGMAIGGAIMGYIMPAAYVSGAETQSAAVQDFIYQCSALIPGVCNALCVLACILIYKFEKELKKQE